MTTLPRESPPQRALRMRGYEDTLLAVFRDMEEHNGEHGDDLEAVVRVAWKMLYRSRTDNERGGIA